MQQPATSPAAPPRPRCAAAPGHRRSASPLRMPSPCASPAEPRGRLVPLRRSSCAPAPLAAALVVLCRAGETPRTSPAAPRGELCRCTRSPAIDLAAAHAPRCARRRQRDAAGLVPLHRVTGDRPRRCACPWCAGAERRQVAISASRLVDLANRCIIPRNPLAWWRKPAPLAGFLHSMPHAWCVRGHFREKCGYVCRSAAGGPPAGGGKPCAGLRSCRKTGAARLLPKV